jgi:NAD(P)-dependent dehydrogenase (short-subunit alcohol dehydrogenase family)
MTTNSSTALITGGTSGIGRAAANKLAQLGIHVVVVGRNSNRGERTVGEIRAAGGEADFISFDLRDASSAREVARRAVELGNGPTRKELSPKKAIGSARKSEFACVSGRRVTVQTRRFFLTKQLTAKISTRIVLNLSQRLQAHAKLLFRRNQTGVNHG